MDSGKTKTLSTVGSAKFPQQEEEILKYWSAIKAFETQTKLSHTIKVLTKRKERRKKTEKNEKSVGQTFKFFEGPPFINSSPHFGHHLAGTIKDVVTRYAIQTGHSVERRFGWDCHGLPIEKEIDKKLGIKQKEDVLKLGIDKYNDECRSIVQLYAEDWREHVGRMGRWIDFDNCYKTMDTSFMESVWWAFAELYKKGLVYRAYKVMPHSTACGTTLSNSEAKSNYQKVTDPAIVVAFSLVDKTLFPECEGERAFLAWTTTPWTLFANVSLCVNPELKYVEIKDTATNKQWILAADCLPLLYPLAPGSKLFGRQLRHKEGKEEKVEIKEEKKSDESKYKVLREFKGSELVGLQYTPLFDSRATEKSSSSSTSSSVMFRIVADSFVSNKEGTGIVHLAPAFGEDDYRVCTKLGIVNTENIPCPVDDNGHFTSEAGEFAGRHVKGPDTDKQIIKLLKSRGQLVKQDTISHEYPHCPRTNTPLIYRIVQSWFIAVEKIKERIVEHNSTVHWVPASVGEAKFHNWLKEARDWAISRQRFWGNPLPVWISSDGKETVVVGSIAELEKLANLKPGEIKDLHRDKIDHITIPSSRGPEFGVLKRVEEVMDCWLESGCMPYGQVHYPFKEKISPENLLPADFIAEGLDQTRGWFYTLMVMSTALFDKPAFKNVIVNGLVLADDGKKMSKSLKNYSPPEKIVNEYGADALRLYLVSSPAAHAEPLLFKDVEVKEVVKRTLLPWWNAYKFFVENVQRYELLTKETYEHVPPRAPGKSPWMPDTTTGTKFPKAPEEEKEGYTSHLLDQWIIARLNKFTKLYHEEMKKYQIYKIPGEFNKFIDDLNNCYIRANRSRAKYTVGFSIEEEQDTKRVLDILFHILFTLARLMSPFTPFIVETMYQNLKLLLPTDKHEEVVESIHYLQLPLLAAKKEKEKEKESTSLLQMMESVQTVINTGRQIRDENKLSLRRPLKEVVVIHHDLATLQQVELLSDYIREELNVRSLRVSADVNSFVRFTAVPKQSILAKKFRAKYKEAEVIIRSWSHEQVTQFQHTHSAKVLGETVTDQEVDIVLQTEQVEGYQVGHDSTTKFTVLINTKQEESLIEEGIARNFTNRVQKMRKDAGLIATDPIEIFCECKEEKKASLLTRVLINCSEYISKVLGKPVKLRDPTMFIEKLIYQETFELENQQVTVWLLRP